MLPKELVDIVLFYIFPTMVKKILISEIILGVVE